MTLTFQDIKDRGLLLYEYIRGSQAFGLATETSDVDTGGVFMCPIDSLLGLGHDYKEEVASSKHDDVWYELNKFFKLLLTSNPTMIEALFVPDDCVLYEHPIMTEIKKHRELFITKKMFPTFFGYGKSQIEKCRGLNKKIVNPVKERLTPLDFCYTFYKQGSTKIFNWLDNRNLDQKYCGLVSVPNMHDVYDVYYDWGNFFQEKNITFEMLRDAFINPSKYDKLFNLGQFILTHYHLISEDNGGWYESETMENLQQWFNNQKPIGYKGIMNEDMTSNELRLSSVSKNELPICHMSYNQTGYTKHCIDYKNYKDWEKNRNPIRYESNLNKNYDAKNVSHAFRLMQMCIEIARGEGIKVRRDEDRQFLLDVKHHKYEYDEIIKKLDEKKIEMDEAIKNSTIPDDINREKVNEILLNIRKTQIKNGL
jgi:predicted nucleotidyltransferase